MMKSLLPAIAGALALGLASSAQASPAGGALGAIKADAGDAAQLERVHNGWKYGYGWKPYYRHYGWKPYYGGYYRPYWKYGYGWRHYGWKPHYGWKRHYHW